MPCRSAVRVTDKPVKRSLSSTGRDRNLPRSSQCAPDPVSDTGRYAVVKQFAADDEQQYVHEAEEEAVRDATV